MRLNFDINDNNIEKSEPASDADFIKFNEQISIDLPPSILDFKRKYADSFYISSGNALSVFPLVDNKDSFTNIMDVSTNYESFINIQFKSLVDTDSISNYDEYYKTLIKKYDNQIEPFGHDSIYMKAKKLSEIKTFMNTI